MTRYAIILAGGSGHRAGGAVPKQFVEICGTRIIYRSMKAFLEFDPTVSLMVVMNPDFIGAFLEMAKKDGIGLNFGICPGGASRAESVKNGLTAIWHGNGGRIPEDAVVAVHDAARPLADSSLIGRGFKAAAPGIGGVPVVPAVNSLRKFASDDGDAKLSERESSAVDRSRYVEVQTPQVFLFRDLFSAYSMHSDLGGFTDDASLAESAGMKIRLYEGSPENMKVTNPMDFKLAEALIREREG